MEAVIGKQPSEQRLFEICHDRTVMTGVSEEKYVLFLHSRLEVAHRLKVLGRNVF